MDKNISSELFRKVLVGLVAGTGSYAHTRYIDQDDMLALELSVLAGGVAFVVMYLVDVEGRLGTVVLKVEDISPTIASQRDADERQLRLLIRYIEEQLPRVIGETLSLKQREEPLVRELT